MPVNYPNIPLNLPAPGEQADTWGASVNAAFQAIDQIFAAAGGGTAVGLHVGAGKTLVVDGTGILDASGATGANVKLPTAVIHPTPTFTGVSTFPSGSWDAAGNVAATKFTGAHAGDGSQLVNIFPAGTRMLFVQAAAPTGWTRVTGFHDRALRISDSTVSAGGANGISVINAGGLTVDGHAITVAEMAQHNHGGATGDDSPDHTHNYTRTNYENRSVSGPQVTLHLVDITTPQQDVVSGGANQRHQHGIPLEGGNAAHNHTYNPNIAYADALIASKN